MNNNKTLRARVNKLLESKNNEYRKKYFILSTLANSKSKNSKKVMTEIYSLCNTLNSTNGNMPTEDYLYEFHSNVLAYSGLKIKNIIKIQEQIKQFVCLNYKSNKLDSLINEELSNIKLDIDRKINRKLISTLIESIELNKNILVENSSSSIFGLDLKSISESSNKNNLFDDISEPSNQDLIDIDAEEDDFYLPEETNHSGGKTLDRIAQIFAPITGKDPQKISKKQIAAMLGYTGLGKYDPTAKTYKLSGWEKMERDIVGKMNTYRNTGLSILAKRKWWIIKSIETCLMLEKQAGKAFGTPDDVKSKFNTTDVDQVSAIQTITKSRRPSGTSLSDGEIRMIMDQVHIELTKGNYDLESPDVKEKNLMSLLKKSALYRADSARYFANDLEIMYPLSDQRAEFDKVEKMSDEELQSLRQQNIEFDKRFEDDDELDVEEKELDVEEKIEVDVIDVDKITSVNNTTETMTASDAAEFFKEVGEDMKRLKALIEKSAGKANPDIFSEFQTDSKGNILPDIKQIPDIIPAEDLTDSEVKEIEDILVKLDKKERITILNYDKRGDVYNDLIDKSVSVDEYIAYMKSFKLDSVDEPMKWRDISRSSYGKFRDTAGARQYGVKAWMKELFYSSNSDEKANIYANLAERWFERLIVLDLVDDKSFTRMASKTGNDKDEKIIPYNVLKDLEAKGKYKRSNKLKDVTDMLEMVNAYTTDPKYVKRYFDYNRDDNLELAVNEKLQSIRNYASSEDEYDVLLKKLELEDKDTAAYAILDSMFNGNSGFRIFATGLLKEYYSQNIWPVIEINLAQAIKKYFDKNYGKGMIAASLPSDAGADSVKQEEGKVLFNKIIYLVMERTGIKSTGTGVPIVGGSREQQRQFFLGETDPRGDFAAAVNKYKVKHSSNIQGVNSPMFGVDDVNMLLDDMFSNTGIIGEEYFKLKKLSSVTSNEIIAWVLSYPEAKLDQAIILGMSLSDFYKRSETDPMITDVIEEIGKDTKKALADYKKKFGSLLAKGTDLADYLDDFGFDPVDLKSKGASSPGGKSFQ